MNEERDRTRELGRIDSIKRDEEHGVESFWVFVAFSGSGQGFGGLVLGKKDGFDWTADYLHDLCATFAVKRPEDLVGKPCFALRCFPDFGAPIEGLESKSGKRFLHTDWRRKHWPDAKDPLTEEIERLHLTIASAERTIALAAAEIKTVRARYVAWPPVYPAPKVTP